MKKSILGTTLKVVIPLAITAILAVIGNYFLLPAITFESGEFWIFLILIGFTAIAAYAIPAWVQYCTSWKDEKRTKPEVVVTNSVIIITAILSIIAIICTFASGKMFNASKYQQIVTVEAGDFNKDFVDISKEDIPLSIIDLETAQRVGDRTIGNLKHSSWFEVDDEFNLIKYQGEYYRLSALNYGGFFKYNKAKADGIPGYVLVNAETAEAKFIEVDGGYKYSPSAYFSNNLKRHLRNQYSSYIFGNSYLEIDETGKPFWVTSVKDSTIGMWGGKVEKNFIITDAKSGESQVYTTEDLPNWVDHAFDLEYLMESVEWHYEYINGYWNFSKTGINDTSYEYKDDETNFAGYNSIIDKNGDVCFYTGLTPANNADSNVGFLIINTRTGKVTQYDCSGAEESSAQLGAEGLVSDLGYSATFPIVVNVGGEETYLMCLKDKAGLIQRFSLCNVKNYAIVIESDSLDGAIEAYLKKLGKDSNNIDNTSQETSKITGKIAEIYSAEIEGTTYFYYQLIGDNNLYKSSIMVNELQVTFKKGDNVDIEYIVTEGIRNITSIK